MGVAGAIRAGAAYVEAFLDDNRLNRGLTAASARLRGWSASLGRLGSATRGGALPEPLAAIANFSFSPAGLVTGMMAAATPVGQGRGRTQRSGHAGRHDGGSLLRPFVCRRSQRR